MPSSSTNVAPPKLASIQTFVSRAGFFWRGGAVSLVLVLGAAVLVAFTVGEIYESESIVEFVEPASPQEKEPQVEQLRRALFDGPRLEQFAREVLSDAAAPQGSSPPSIDVTRQAIVVRPRGGRQFSIAYRASMAAAAQRGSDWLTQSAAHSLEGGADSGGEEVARRTKALEDRTRELASFVAEHPEVALSPSATAPRPSASGASSAPPPADSALVVLQQQRATLEWRIADAEKKEATGKSNPYDAPTDRAALQRMLAQVRAAIAARQAVALRTGAEASSGHPSAPAPKSSASAGLYSEWQRLLEAVVQAQQQTPSKRETAAGAALRIVQRASLPNRPLKPDTRLICLLGLAGGVWAGIIWAFARVALGHDLRGDWRDIAEGDEGEEGEPAGDPAGVDVPAGWGPAAAPYDATILPALEAGPSSDSPTTARDGTAAWQFAGAIQPAPGGSNRPSRIPKQLLSTSPGVIDASRVLAQTGTAPNRVPPARGPIVELKPPPNAAPPPDPAPHPQVRPAYSSHPPGQGLNQGPSHIRATGTTQTFASPMPSWHNEPGGSGHPPAAGRPPQTPTPPPTYGLALRQKGPEDVFSLRDVPLGWAPDPSMLQTGSMNELLTLRDQLYRLSRNGCFTVGVTSGPNATSDKSCVAAQLAAMLAGPGRVRVLLIEANFDRPSVHRLMHVDMPFSQGFSEQMRKRMTPAPRTPWVLFRCAPHLHVLAEGLVRSPGLLSSVQFGEALSELRAYYDVIVADGPIAENTIDTVAFDALMDGIVVVGAVGSAPAKLLEEVSQHFTRKQLMAVISADASAEGRIEFGPQTT